MGNETVLTISKQTDGDVTTLVLEGILDENADLREAFDAIESKKVVIDLKGVLRINSTGVRKWINATRDLKEKFDITFVKCSGAVVSQLNMITNFLSSGKIESIYGPYVCEKCGKKHDMLIDIARNFEDEESKEDPEAPDFGCPECGETMDFDEYEEKYFSFLQK